MAKQNKKKTGTNSSYDKNRMFNTDFVNSVINNHNPSTYSINNSIMKFEEYK